MARANRHFISGYAWHPPVKQRRKRFNGINNPSGYAFGFDPTSRCHKREFLLKFAKDKQRWMYWLFEAKKRFGLCVLNFTVTSNHIHLLVADDKFRNVIPDSIKLVAGRTGQEFNQRKARKGAYWEDRYHATAIEDGDHLIKCIVYIDLNMVRAGVVKHPSDWPYSGYNEIQQAKRKKILINYEKLKELLGFDSYEHLKTAHKRWVESCISDGDNFRDSKWTESIAVGSEAYIQNVKDLMGGMALGRKVLETGDSFQLKEVQNPYIADYGVKKSEIGAQNTYFWDQNFENTTA